MIGIDTNVLVRYLVQDDAIQAAKAGRLIEDAAARQELIHVSQVVLCELVWVLETAYSLPREDVLDAVETILRTADFDLEAGDIAWLALQDSRSNNADFSDCLIGRHNQLSDCASTFTFDKKLKRLKYYTLL
jgi:predicted nucleic-acid-binding protein